MIIHKRVKSMLPVINKKDIRTPLTRLYVSNKEAVVTDGHVLVRTPLDDDDVDMPGATGEPEIEPVLIDINTIERAIKNLPVKPKLLCNHYIQVKKTDDQLFVSSGVPIASFPVQCAQDGYPDYERVIPDYEKNNPLKFILDGKQLRKICDMAIKHGDHKNRVIFEIPRDGNAVLTTPLKFIIQDDDGQDVFTGLIMSLKAMHSRGSRGLAGNIR